MTNEKMLELLNKEKYEELKNGLIENIRIETEKGKGTKVKDLTIIKRVNCMENLYGYHPLNLYDKEYKCFTDGHYILASEQDFGYNKAEKPFNMSKLVNESMFDDTIEIKVDMTDLTTFKKVNKKDITKHPYIFENEKIRIGFNPNFLFDALTFCKTDTIYVTKSIAPAYIKSESKDRVALVLPVNLKVVDK